jgi:DNA-binding FadR family transcriptional regulator
MSENIGREEWPINKGMIQEGGTTPKRASVLAAEMELNIIQKGRPVGTTIGSEAELIEEYGVSRAVLREAIRLLEHHQIAEMRRGRNGGLRITQPNPSAVANAVAIYLRFRNVSPSDLYDVRLALEMTSVRLATERATEAEVEELRHTAARRVASSPDELANEGAAFHEAVARVSGNPIIHLIVQVINLLSEVLVDNTRIVEVAENNRRAHQAIAEAIATGDSALAQRRLLRHFEAAADVGYPFDIGTNSE